MNEVYGNGNYVRDSIACSRSFQEVFGAQQGITGYGKLASLIAVYTEQIDRVAERLGEYIAYRSTVEDYAQQYGNSSILGTAKRVMTSSSKAFDFQVQRRNTAFVKRMAVETGIKLAARGMQKFLGDKEKYSVCDQIYRILLSYAIEEDNVIKDSRVEAELNKIRNSLPLSEGKRIKLSEISVANLDIFHTDLSILNSSDNTRVKESLSYFLYVLYAQKYGDSPIGEGQLLRYYDRLGFQGAMGQELLRENKNSYDIVTDDQLKYLMLSRAMFKNLEPKIPEINLQQIARRTEEMARNDPYRIRKRMVLKAPSIRKRTIMDLFFEEPDVVIQAGATAFSQLNLNDDAKEDTRKLMIEKWELDDKAVDMIMSEANDIKKESTRE